MSITVYTYHDPYKLNDNVELWTEISNCPYFCVSQTMVNGLKTVYGGSFQIGRVTTVMNLSKSLWGRLKSGAGWIALSYAKRV